MPHDGSSSMFFINFCQFVTSLTKEFFPVARPRLTCVQNIYFPPQDNLQGDKYISLHVLSNLKTIMEK